jgi:hypothetical protein
MGRSDRSAQDSPPDRAANSASISLTLRDQNIIRAPRRTSSLKLQSISTRVSKPPNPTHLPCRKAGSSEVLGWTKITTAESPLKVCKTRNTGALATTEQAKDGARGQSTKSSLKTAITQEVLGKLSHRRENIRPPVTGSDCVSSQYRILKNSEPRLLIQSSSETDVTSNHSQTSRPSTSTSYLDTGPAVQNQQLQRRNSVRHAVTKAFANLNKKKRVADEVQNDSFETLSNLQILSQSYPSICTSSYSRDVSLPLRDSAISMIGDVWHDQSSSNLYTLITAKIEGETSRREEATLPARRYSDDIYIEPLSPVLRVQHESPPTLSRLNTPVLSEAVSCLTHVLDEPPLSAILRVRLAVKPELKQVDLFSQETVWCAVQMHGEMAYQTTSGEPTSLASLALAVILDNS